MLAIVCVNLKCQVILFQNIEFAVVMVFDQSCKDVILKQLFLKHWKS